MHLETDLEFKQNQIKKLIDQFNIEMFHTKVRGEKHLLQNKKIESLKRYY